jgi:hypothetical protein
MTNEQVLEKQVEALERLLRLKEAIIEELDNKVQKLQSQGITTGSGAGYSPYVQQFRPSWICSDGNPHQYPQVWQGVVPPPCDKCGQFVLQPYQGYGNSGITLSPANTTTSVVSLSSAAKK